MGAADLHTIVDHFTIGLINIGIVFELCGFLFKHEGMRRFSWNALRLGLPFGLLSILTGLITSANVLITPQVEALNQYHKVLSLVVVGVLTVAILLRSSRRELFEAQEGAAVRGAYLALVSMAFILIGITGFLGTRMVYTYGVNVQPYERILESMPPPVMHPTPPMGLKDSIVTP